MPGASLPFRMYIAGYEVLTAVVMNIVIFWNIAPCSPYVNRCFGGTYHSIFATRWFLVRLILILKIELIYSSETSVHIRTTRRYIPEYGNIYIPSSFSEPKNKPSKRINEQQVSFEDRLGPRICVFLNHFRFLVSRAY
jgi:hypothetical protein